MMFSIVLLLCLTYMTIYYTAAEETISYNYAVCYVKPNPSKLFTDIRVYGNVYFKQKSIGGSTSIIVNLTGFSKTNSAHGFHIHTYGTIKEGCDGAGGHYNPYGQLHGSPEDVNRHVGDLGNVQTSSNGTVFTQITDNLVSLVNPYSVMGRAVVIHQRRDDLGRGTGGHSDESLKSGNAGTRLACCVISAATGDFWDAN